LILEKINLIKHLYLKNISKFKENVGVGNSFKNVLITKNAQTIAKLNA